jgi:hypothetical protein
MTMSRNSTAWMAVRSDPVVVGKFSNWTSKQTNRYCLRQCNGCLNLEQPRPLWSGGASLSGGLALRDIGIFTSHFKVPSERRHMRYQ